MSGDPLHNPPTNPSPLSHAFMKDMAVIEARLSDPHTQLRLMRCPPYHARLVMEFLDRIKEGVAHGFSRTPVGTSASKGDAGPVHLPPRPVVRSSRGWPTAGLTHDPEG